VDEGHKAILTPHPLENVLLIISIEERFKVEISEEKIVFFFAMV